MCYLTNTRVRKCKHTQTDCDAQVCVTSAEPLTVSSALQRRPYDNNKPPYCHGNNCTIAKATAAECYNKQENLHTFLISLCLLMLVNAHSCLILDDFGDAGCSLGRSHGTSCLLLLRCICNSHSPPQHICFRSNSFCLTHTHTRTHTHSPTLPLLFSLLLCPLPQFFLSIHRCFAVLFSVSLFPFLSSV